MRADRKIFIVELLKFVGESLFFVRGMNYAWPQLLHVGLQGLNIDATM